MTLEQNRSAVSGKAILHNAGSRIVVFNSARLVRHGEELEPFAAEVQKIWNHAAITSASNGAVAAASGLIRL